MGARGEGRAGGASPAERMRDAETCNYYVVLSLSLSLYLSLSLRTAPQANQVRGVCVGGRMR